MDADYIHLFIIIDILMHEHLQYILIHMLWHEHLLMMIMISSWIPNDVDRHLITTTIYEQIADHDLLIMIGFGALTPIE